MVNLKIKIVDFADLKDLAELQASIKAKLEKYLDKEMPSIVEIFISPKNTYNNDAEILALILLELKQYRNCKKVFIVNGHNIEYGF